MPQATVCVRAWVPDRPWQYLESGKGFPRSSKRNKRGRAAMSAMSAMPSVETKMLRDCKPPCRF